VRSGNIYTANGAVEMIKEIVASIKTDDLEILFRIDCGYFDEEIIAKHKKVQPRFPPGLGKNNGKIISLWNFSTSRL